MDDEVRYVVGAAGEVSRLVGAYRRAVHGAQRLRAGLVAAGLDPEDVTAIPGLSESGDAAVHVTVLPVVAAQLSALVGDDDAGGSPPRPGRPRGDPTVA